MKLRTVLTLLIDGLTVQEAARPRLRRPEAGAAAGAMPLAPEQPIGPAFLLRIAEHLAPSESTLETQSMEATQPPAPSSEVAPPPSSPESPAEESSSGGSPVDLLAKLLRGESARPDGS